MNEPRLNAPRTIPFDFRAVEIDGWIWLFDDSERTYICSANATIWAEPLYPVDGEDYDFPASDYFGASNPAFAKAVKVPVDCDAKVDAKEAWEEAQEEANANHVL